jgi:hypothetical protein
MYNRLTINNIPVYNITLSSTQNISIKEITHQQTSNIEQLTNKNKKINILNDLNNWKKDGLNTIKYKINNIRKLKYNNINKYNVNINLKH